VSQARSLRTEAVTQAEAEQKRFLAWSAARKRLAFEQEWPLFLEAVDGLLENGDAEAAYATYRAKRDRAAAAQAALLDFRLYWESLGRALMGRDMVLIDAENVPGRRHLLLFDPDQLRMPFPVFAPPSRESAPRSPLKSSAKDEDP
jgi:hypothetical protein